MTPDPVAKLAKFTPTALDPAELLFAAGRASARTHWLWKFAVALLVASNAALGAWLALRSPTVLVVEPVTVPVVPPVSEPPAAQTVPPTSGTVDDPSSYRVLRAGDLEHLPRVEAFTSAAPREPLTALSGRRGELE